MQGEELEQYYMAALLSNPSLVTRRSVDEAECAAVMLELSDMASIAASIYDEEEGEKIEEKKEEES